MASSIAIFVLQTQFEDLIKEPVDGFSVGMVNDNVFEWKLTIRGPSNSLYDGGRFNAIMSFTSEYPFKPPSLRFISDIYHPNVFLDGRVAISILEPPPNSSETLRTEYWSPSCTARGVLVAIISALCSPDFESPANTEAAREWRESRQEFELKVKRCVEASVEDD